MPRGTGAPGARRQCITRSPGRGGLAAGSIFGGLRSAVRVGVEMATQGAGSGTTPLEAVGDEAGDASGAWPPSPPVRNSRWSFPLPERWVHVRTIPAGATSQPPHLGNREGSPKGVGHRRKLPHSAGATALPIACVVRCLPWCVVCRTAWLAFRPGDESGVPLSCRLGALGSFPAFLREVRAHCVARWRTGSTRDPPWRPRVPGVLEPTGRE